MSNRTGSRLALLPALAVAAALLAANVMGAEPGPEAARLDSFAHPDGANYFALSLRPAEGVPAAGAHDVVVLFDTSASQTGDFREQALSALKSLLGGLSPNDRVQLVAVDVSAIGMTQSFVAPGSQEMADAIKKLEGRVPLGATDMEKALRATVARYAGAGANARAAVYIGDGMSTANLVGTESFEQLAGSLVENQIAVSSYAVGPKLDVQVLGALAANTGGQLIQGPEVEAEEAGTQLAGAAQGAVLWPESVTWPGEFSEVFPRTTPPLRTDRDTVIIGTFQGEGPFEVRMTVDTADGSKPLTWTVAPGAPVDTNNYIARLVESARIDGGMSLPLAGSASLKAAERAIGAGLQQVSELAVQALSSGDLDSAERLAREALRQDPEDMQARTVASAVARRRAGGAAEVGGAADLNLLGAGAAAKGFGGPAAPAAAPGAFMDAVDRQQKVIAQMVTADVQNTINQARGKMSEEPEAAIQDIKLQLESVRRAPEIEPDVRDQLVDQLQAAVREAERRQIELEQRRQQQHEALAAAKERALINENLLRQQQKMEQLMERFNSLMDEGRFRMAEEDIALEAQALAPNDPVPVLATLHSRMVGYYVDQMALRAARQKAVVDTLYEVEKAYMPFPGEPPILYPPAEVWQQLTARRREKYSSMDLASQGASEMLITKALKDPTELEFIETPLQDVIDTLEDYHKIQIEIDTKALDDVGVPTDVPVTKSLKGISLRSGLRIMLGELDLTYVIEDEVLKITTPEEAENKLSTKVYPVADLVIPITSGMGMSGFGGMGGMGGGMGMFNVPQNVLPNVPAGGFRAFSVKDDLNLSPQAEAKKPVPETSPKKNAKPRSIEVDESVEPQVFWDRHFANSPDQSPATVRQAVRDLMHAKKFDHVIALVQAALRHHQPEPWMYEAMALAMQAAGSPADQVERAVLSAIDFADNPLDMMYIALYLDQIGLEKRALQIYRQVSEMVPLRHEPYMHGLKIAQRLDDLDGIKWACAGILGQAWSEEKKDVWLAGLGAAHDTLKRLRVENRSTEAEEFQAALDQAVIRDVVVEVSWTGDADVDLMVEEPSGTVCSFRNPRTTAGGVMLGDTYSHLGHNPADGFRETYVCPKAFSGPYRMLLRCVWGDVTAGKVAVTIRTGVWDEGQRMEKQMVALKNGEAVVQFDLDGGRREASLQQHQVANAAIGHLAVRHHVLAQQLAANADPGSLASFAASRQRSFAGGFVPVVGGGAVGYQPVIITLPEGTNLMSMAVISADRRYVRITPQPLFSGVAEVNTFNTFSGQGGQTGGGTGGQGFTGMMGGGGGGGGGMGGMGGMGGGMGGGMF